MREISFIACLLGCACLGLLWPGPASAAVVPTLQFDDVTESPSASVTGFNSGFVSILDTSSGNEVVSFAGSYNLAANATFTSAADAFVVLLDPRTQAVSDILDITFVQIAGSKLISINGTFTSDGDPGTPLVAPEGVPTITETGDWQDVSQILQAQGFRSDLEVLIRSDVDSSGNVVPEPASMIVWSFIACCVGVPGLRRRWRAATSAV